MNSIDVEYKKIKDPKVKDGMLRLANELALKMLSKFPEDKSIRIVFGEPDRAAEIINKKEYLNPEVKKRLINTLSLEEVEYIFVNQDLTYTLLNGEKDKLMPKPGNLYSYSSGLQYQSNIIYDSTTRKIYEIVNQKGEVVDPSIVLRDYAKARSIINEKQLERQAVEEEKSKQAEKERATVRIGMTKQDVLDRWGKPKDINKTITTYGVHEQWVYSIGRYVYFDDGIVTAIQE